MQVDLCASLSCRVDLFYAQIAKFLNVSPSQTMVMESSDCLSTFFPLQDSFSFFLSFFFLSVFTRISSSDVRRSENNSKCILDFYFAKEES